MVAAKRKHKETAAEVEPDPAETFDLNAFVGGNAGVLPPSLPACCFDGKWWIPKKELKHVPAEQRTKLMYGYTHHVEKAKTGLSVCKRCGEKIPKGELRIGYPVKDHRGEYGAVSLWLHLSCSKADESLVKYFNAGEYVNKKLVGYDALTGEEKAEVATEVLKKATPVEEDLSEAVMPAVPAARVLPRHDKPSALKVPMLPFQAEGLSWMLERENDRTTKGGVLADEMGMGKTLQMIGLLLASKSTGPNLVVCPAAAMLQWRNEITRFVEDGALGVELYYGNDRKTRDYNGLGNIVVLTTYQTLEADYRHEVNKYKVKCEWCERMFLPEKLKFHQQYFCGPDAQRTDKQKMQVTNSDLKSEAVKRMKIGGMETTITIAPLDAIRRASMAHLHAKRKIRKAQQADAEAASSTVTKKPAATAKCAAAAAAAAAAAGSSQTPSPSKLSRTTSWSRALRSSETPTKPERLSSWGRSLRSASSGSIALDVDLGDEDSDLELVTAMEPVKVEQLEQTSSLAGAAPSAPSEGVKTDQPLNSALVEDLPPDPGSEEDDGEDIDCSASPLFRTRWNRVILDEAHRIKGRVNSTAQASFKLKVETSRWCLSGTPLQNRVGEVYSILRFLRYYPYAHFICSKKGCSCASLHYRFDPDTSQCKKCGHTKFSHKSYFAATISNPVKKYGYLGAGRAAIERLRSDVLDRILLRRTKAERHNDLQLPPMEVHIRRDNLSAEESDFYKAMYQNSLTEFDTYVEKGTVLHNYAHIFDLIMRLRQAVDHPYLIVHGSLRTESGPIPTKSRCEQGLGVCALCQDDFDDLSQRVVAQCGHPFHRDCVADYLEQAPELSSGGVGCPACYAPLTVSLEEQPFDGDAGEAEGSEPLLRRKSSKVLSIMQRIKTAEFKSSTKIEALLQEIRQMMAADPTSKALVFSQFITFLELIEWRLKTEGVSCAKLMGSMSIVSKNNMIIAFQTDPSLKVMLISLKAGGEGLNLQAANHIFLMDPWWNPASELQAMQRAHRIGQTRPVKAIRFVAKDTIEEKIIELQGKKQAVFDCSVGNSNQALQRLRGEDIRFLFSK